MANRRFTVYIPSHNYGRFLGEAIESVLRQSVDDWELIVVDDGSTDDTAEVMNLYRGHPRISLHRKEGIGLTAVCNFALGLAQGEYVIRLDGDDVFDENILLVLGNCLDRDPDLALAFPDYYLVDKFGEVFGQERRQRLYSQNHSFDLPPNGACTLVRASVLKEIGGYREDLGAQDGFDLWTKVVTRYKCANVNLPLFYYRKHGTNLTTDTQRIINARRQIKKDAVRERLSTSRPVIAVIPCRRDFDFTTDLWKQEIGGQSLLERDIRVTCSSDMFDHIVVTCDNPETEAWVKRFDDSRLQFVLRDPQSTIRSASIVPTLEADCAIARSELNGITVVRYIQSPFVNVDTLEEAVSTLAMSDADSANGVEEITSRVFRRTAHGIEMLNRRGELRSDFDTIYRDVQTCVAARNRNFPTGSLMGRSTVSYVVSAAECFFIDSGAQDEDRPVDDWSERVNLGKVGVVVAARTSSTRLPGKALLPMQGLPMLTFLLRRLQPLQSGIVVLATTDLAVDDQLAELAAREKIGVFRGSETDLVARYVGAATEFGLDTVARVTADCPFVDAEMVDWCVARARELDHFDLATTKGQFPVGLDVEIYHAAAMRKLAAEAPLSPAHREHLTLYFYDHRDAFAVRPISPPPDWRKMSRSFTVDTPDDYRDAQSLAARFERCDFRIAALLDVVIAGSSAGA